MRKLPGMVEPANFAKVQTAFETKIGWDASEGCGQPHVCHTFLPNAAGKEASASLFGSKGVAVTTTTTNGAADIGPVAIGSGAIPSGGRVTITGNGVSPAVGVPFAIGSDAVPSNDASAQMIPVGLPSAAGKPFFDKEPGVLPSADKEAVGKPFFDKEPGVLPSADREAVGKPFFEEASEILSKVTGVDEKRRATPSSRKLAEAAKEEELAEAAKEEAAEAAGLLPTWWWNQPHIQALRQDMVSDLNDDLLHDVNRLRTKGKLEPLRCAIQNQFL